MGTNVAKTAAIQPTVDGWIMYLTGALTQYDKRMSSRRGYNPNALGHYMGAVGNIRKDMRGSEDSSDPVAMEKLKKSIHRRFIKGALSPVERTVKNIDKYLATGAVPNYGRAAMVDRIAQRHIDAGCEKLPPALREQCEKKQDGAKDKKDGDGDDKPKEKSLPPWLKGKGDDKKDKGKGDDKKDDDKKDDDKKDDDKKDKKASDLVAATRAYEATLKGGGCGKEGCGKEGCDDCDGDCGRQASELVTATRAYEASIGMRHEAKSLSDLPGFEGLKGLSRSEQQEVLLKALADNAAESRKLKKKVEQAAKGLHKKLRDGE